MLSLAPVDPVTGPDARRVAREELSRGGYRHDAPNWLERVGDWLARHIAELFGGGGGVGGNALLIFAVLLVVVVAFVVVRAGLPGRARRQRVHEDADPLAASSARDHRRRAGEYAAAGNHALALREYLRATVATIEERGVLPPRPGRTGAVTAREAGPLLPSAAHDLAVAMDAFDQVWFGGRPASAQDVDRARSAADAVAAGRLAGVAPGPVTPPGIAVPE